MHIPTSPEMHLGKKYCNFAANNNSNISFFSENCSSSCLIVALFPVDFRILDSHPWPSILRVKDYKSIGSRWLTSLLKSCVSHLFI